MKSFETWFKNSFLAPPSPCCGEVELLQQQKKNTYVLWLFGTTFYLSVASFLLWVVGMNAIHYADKLSDRPWIEKLFFFSSPTTWKNYLLRFGGLFNIVRSASGLGEKVFIFSNLGLVLLSIVNLSICLTLINITCQRDCNELRVVTYPLCFPAFGCLASLLVIAYFQILKNRTTLRIWAQTRPFWGSLLLKYIDFLNKREKKRFAFKPKTRSYLKLKKEPLTLLDNLNKIEEYATR